MNIQSDQRMDKAAFIAWNASVDGRYELVGGSVAMMTGGSRAHWLIARNLIIALHRRLDPRAWEVGPEFGVDSDADTLRYPDVVVDRVAGAARDHTAAGPVLLAEVLAPSTATIDLGDKASEYLRLPSLLAYLVLSQDEPKAWLWVRSEGVFRAGSEVIVGTEATVQVEALKLELPLAEIYAGVPFG
jgi:Uma2 family endonuclease